jgi:hypothetical protein
MDCKIKNIKPIHHTADPITMQPLDCWGREFESQWGHGYMISCGCYVGSSVYNDLVTRSEKFYPVRI